jgi:hypothetical protein
VVTGSFFEDSPAGKWTMNSPDGPKFELDYTNGHLSSVKILSEGKTRTFSVLSAKSEKPSTGVIGATYLSYNAEKNKPEEKPVDYTLLYSDSEKTAVTGLVVSLRGKSENIYFRFLPDSVFNGATGEFDWFSDSPRWSVYEKKGTMCRVGMSGDFSVSRPQKIVTYFPWVECSGVKDAIEHYKNRELGIDKSVSFFNAPEGKRIYPKVPKPERKKNKKPNDDEDDGESFTAEIIESQVLHGVTWVKINLSSNGSSLGPAWVRFHNGLNPVFQIYTD